MGFGIAMPGRTVVGIGRWLYQRLRPASLPCQPTDPPGHPATPHNLQQVANLRRMLDGEQPEPMKPWYRGFKGTIEEVSGQGCLP